MTTTSKTTSTTTTTTTTTTKTTSTTTTTTSTTSRRTTTTTSTTTIDGYTQRNVLVIAISSTDPLGSGVREIFYYLPCPSTAEKNVQTVAMILASFVSTDFHENFRDRGVAGMRTFLPAFRWRLRGSVLEGLGMIFKTFASFFARCLEDVSSSNPSSDFSHPGRAETSKKR